MLSNRSQQIIRIRIHLSGSVIHRLGFCLSRGRIHADSGRPRDLVNNSQRLAHAGRRGLCHTSIHIIHDPADLLDRKRDIRHGVERIDVIVQAVCLPRLAVEVIVNVGHRLPGLQIRHIAACLPHGPVTAVGGILLLGIRCRLPCRHLIADALLDDSRAVITRSDATRLLGTGGRIGGIALVELLAGRRVFGKLLFVPQQALVPGLSNQLRGSRLASRHKRLLLRKRRFWIDVFADVAAQEVANNKFAPFCGKRLPDCARSPCTRNRSLHAHGGQHPGRKGRKARPCFILCFSCCQS